ncbi:MAG: ATP synthase subunit alpha [Rubricoccaceae bacterium]
MPDAPASSTPNATPSADLPTLALADDEAGEPGVERRPPVVVGWVQAGPLDEGQREAFKQARALVRSALRRQLPDFAWTFPLVRRRDLVSASEQVEPIMLLDAGATERRLGGWDFVLVVTAADLHAWTRPFALATPSQALDAAVLSLARLDLNPHDRALDPTERTEILSHRLAALTLHAFGHLNGLDHEADPEAVMHAPRSPADLDTSSLSFTDANRAEIEEEVADVADPRMEEETAFERLGDAAFALKAILLNWADVADTVLQIRPWRFPFQLSKLTTAAFSTLVVLIMTAEAWDLGTRQPVGLIVSMSLVAILGTSAYLVRKQALLASRLGQARSEQHVVQAVSILLALSLGMATTWALLFGTTMLLGSILFDGAIVDGWAANLGQPVGPGHRLVFSGFVAALGLLVGALGASFEDQTYFRHVAYVDEET